jgi:hypothetical protein
MWRLLNATADFQQTFTEWDIRSWFKEDNDCLDWQLGNDQSICTQCIITSCAEVGERTSLVLGVVQGSSLVY